MSGLWRPALACLLLAVTTPPRAAELDVHGNWQLNIDCGYAATATSFLEIGQDPGVQTITGRLTSCGTVEVPGAISRFATCSTSPTVFTGSLVNGEFRLPDAGGWVSNATGARDLNIPGACSAAHSLEVKNTLTGGILKEVDGRATVLGGMLMLGRLVLRRADGSECFVLDDAPDCHLDARRNDLAVGTNVNVSPRFGASVTFEQVLTPGTVAVMPLTEPDVDVPARFAVLGNGSVRLYYDVHTTATVAGAIETCFPYPDANGDGVVDATNPPLDEDDLVVLHSEDGAFVDRTERVDTIRKVVCANTNSLSQMTVAQPEVTRPVDLTAAAYRLRLDRGRLGRERLVFETSQVSFGAAAGEVDPRRTGAVLEVFSATESPAARLDLQASGWTVSRNGKRLRFSGDPASGSGTVSATIGAKTRITADAVGLGLAAPQVAVVWRLSIGDRRWCATASDHFKDNRRGHYRAGHSWSNYNAPIVDCADKRISWFLDIYGP